MGHIRCYSELIQIPDYKERFEYLKLSGKVGAETFGHDRYLNQIFYASQEWRRFRDKIIIRDNGCDMGIDGYEINTRATIHHIEPICVNDILHQSSRLFDEENVICVSSETHKAIHYGDSDLLVLPFAERKPNDMCPWRK